jgi:AhpD family alkylhydroperoxidase
MNTLNIAEKLLVPWTKETAPEASRPVLEHVEKVFGFVPNLMGTLAGAPAAAKGYHALIFEFTKGSLSPQAQQLVLLAVSVENKGSYCTLAHSETAKALAHMPAEVINAVRNREPIVDAKLNALISLTRELVRERGYADPELVQAFIAAGYRKEQIMEILLGIAVKTISNYLDHISPVEIDREFQSMRDAHVIVFEQRKTQ